MLSDLKELFNSKNEKIAKRLRRNIYHYTDTITVRVFRNQTQPRATKCFLEIKEVLLDDWGNIKKEGRLLINSKSCILLQIIFNNCKDKKLETKFLEDENELIIFIPLTGTVCRHVKREAVNCLKMFLSRDVVNDTTIEALRDSEETFVENLNDLAFLFSDDVKFQSTRLYLVSRLNELVEDNKSFALVHF
uniref:Uncharacterized protein n=1 Tax=Rhabditophanes sp. KR3021 TaxID=114890 RepID=A0AC35TT88_9BILA